MAGHEFKRKDSLFSLCGLNCNLCPSLVRGVCPGCQAGSHCASVCPFAPCSAQHGDVTYCFECVEFPCSHYDGVDEHDSLISHRNQFKDIQKAQTMGMEKYHEEQIAKRKVLDRILKEYDDGSNDVYFCMVVNLLELDDLKSILKQLMNPLEIWI
ncbi:DUF3795 domain-containing protein [Methanobrevibacter sp.]